MSSLDKSKYDSKIVESELYKDWEDAGLFKPKGKGSPYCIVLPPPNVTGSLHMGHAFQDTLMDMLIRFKKMNGHRALWQGGTDHAGIATQLVVERQLELAGTSRVELGRDKFIEAVWDWKAESGGHITQQLRRMGASIDWSRERFTLDEDLSAAVRKVFVDLYNEGLIYRGKRLVNWDPALKTAVSDLEVNSELENGYLWSIKYPLKHQAGYVTVATTRPETMLGDTAIAVNPDDERYKNLIGQEVHLPLTDRTIKIISDAYVDSEFGTGCLKITPAHDFNDYEIGKRHNLDFINILDEGGYLNENVPQEFQGMYRTKARKKIVSLLEEKGLLVRIDNHQLSVPRGDRSGEIIEPYLTDQWFVKTKPLAKEAISAIKNDEIKFIPQSWTKTYLQWMYNIEDWCISRQLWWGHRIPAWYDMKGNVYVGHSEEEIRDRENIASSEALFQDQDVLDTWFSSALWPFSTLGWPQKNNDMQTFYPTDVLVTGFDIIFFWVARMIMMGLKLVGKIPFKEVYIHGLVRDSSGQKMSKSKGNIIDPIDLIDGISLKDLIEKRTSNLLKPEEKDSIKKATEKDYPNGIPSFGTDALRMTFAAMATQGRDIKFDLGRLSGYRNFCNKIWNASKFITLVGEEHKLTTKDFYNEEKFLAWGTLKLHQLIKNTEKNFANYRFDLIAANTYSFFWEHYCDWIIETAKIILQDPKVCESRKSKICHELNCLFSDTLLILNPIMPFITETLWTKHNKQITRNPFHEQAFPTRTVTAKQRQLADEYEYFRNFVVSVRKIRAQYSVKPSAKIAVVYSSSSTKELGILKSEHEKIKQLTKLTALDNRAVNPRDGNVATAVVGDTTISISLKELIDLDSELKRLKSEIGKMNIIRERAVKKVNNQKFLENAPKQIIEKEQDKISLYSKNIQKIDNQIKELEANNK